MNTGISSILFIFCLVLSTELVAQKSLWLIAGQSNASGMGDRRASDKYVSEGCFEYMERGDSLRILKDPLGESGKYFGKANSGSIAPSFGWHLREATGDSVIVVSAARGGSACSYEAETVYGTWASVGKLKIFAPCIVKVKMAERQTGVKLQGVLWLQGERDANAINDGRQTEEGYGEALKDLIARFRQELGNPSLPFYIVMTGQYTRHPQPGYLAVRRMQREIANEDKYVFLAPIDPWYFPQDDMMTDNIHYAQPAYNRIGAILAQEVMETNALITK